MADTKTTQLPAIDAVALTDLVAVVDVDDPGGTPASKKATVTQLRDALNSGAIVSAGGILSAEGNPPQLLLKNTAAGLDQKYWRLTGFAGALHLDAVNDTFSQGSTVPLQILRSGLTIPNIVFRCDGVTDDAITLLAKTQITDRVTVTGAVPTLMLNEADGVSNERRWMVAANGGALAINLMNDADNVWGTALLITRTSVIPGPVSLPDHARGAGAVRGRELTLGRNTSGNGAASALTLAQRDGVTAVLWLHGGKLRLGSAAPTEDDSVAHTSGVVVGEQTTALADVAALSAKLDAALLRIAALEAQR